jgi:hypothetical protein
MKRMLERVTATSLAGESQVGLVVVEESRDRRVNNFDRAVRKRFSLSQPGLKVPSLMTASPSAEHLLWLPDLACSAYRRQLVAGQTEFFGLISASTEVLECEGPDISNPRLP